MILDHSSSRKFDGKASLRVTLEKTNNIVLSITQNVNTVS